MGYVRDGVYYDDLGQEYTKEEAEKDFRNEKLAEKREKTQAAILEKMHRLENMEWEEYPFEEDDKVGCVFYYDGRKLSLHNALTAEDIANKIEKSFFVSAIKDGRVELDEFVIKEMINETLLQNKDFVEKKWSESIPDMFENEEEMLEELESIVKINFVIDTITNKEVFEKGLLIAQEKVLKKENNINNGMKM